MKKKKTWVLNIFESSRSIKKIFSLGKKKTKRKTYRQTNKQMKIKTKIKMKCFHCENEYFFYILFLKIICSPSKTQTHSSVLKIIFV